MKAMVIVSGKEGGRLELREVPKPEPRSGELLIRVQATALNRADLYQLKGAYPTQAGAGGSVVIAGLEAVGEVAAVGENVSGFALGDRIMAMCAGGYAEFATLDYRMAMRIPQRLSWEEAAAIPVAYMTAHDALVTNARVQAGDAVLIHAASSGVGVAAIQIAKFLGANPVMGTAGSPAKLAALTSLGMDLGINYRTENFAERVLKTTNGAGVDVIIDHVGGTYLKENLRCLAIKGRLVSVGRLGGGFGELDLELMALKRLHLIGVTYRTRTIEEKIAIAQRCRTDLLPAVAEGRLRPVIDRVFPLEQAREAQMYMASNTHIGKIILRVS